MGTQEENLLLPNKDQRIEPVSLRDRARQAIAAGDQVAACALLRQLLVDEPMTDFSPQVTEAIVTTASTRADSKTRERYVRTQRELDDWLTWLATADLDFDDLARMRRSLDERADQLVREARERLVEEPALASDASQRRRLGAGWLEAKLIPKPNGRVNGPYLYYRARADGHRRSVYLGKLAK